MAILTKLRSDMKLVARYVAWNQAACPQGQPLAWLGYDGLAEEHWLGTGPGTGVVRAVLGSGALPATICVSARAARNVAGSAAASQPDGATSVATGPPLD